MADRFDELMMGVAQAENASVDYDALKQAILTENIKRSKKRIKLTRTLSAAAVFAVVATVGSIALTHMGSGSSADSAEYMTEATSVEDSFDMAMLAENAEPGSEGSGLGVAEDAPEIPGCCTVTEGDASDTEADTGTASGAKSSVAEDAEAKVQRLLLLSSGGHYTIGTPNYNSCACIGDVEVETIGGVTYTTLACAGPTPVMEVGQAYITELDGVLTALWQVSNEEYILAECEENMTSAELIEILQSMC